MARNGKIGTVGLRRTLRSALVGPQALAFLPALILGGYWFGGEGVLIISAVLVPGLLLVLGFFDRSGAGIAPGADPTTGMPCRETALAHLETIFSEGQTRAQMTGCIALGIDEIDRLLDRLGRRTCERLMAVIGDRLRGVIRGHDFVARTDDFEFAVVLSSAGRADLEILLGIANRLQRAVSDPIPIDGGRIYLTASAGLCTPADVGQGGGGAMLSAAEVALAEAQASGTAGIRAFSPDMTARATLRAGLAGEVGAALEDGQFRPWFQPQIDTLSGRIVGAEALARWHHPERGLVSPGDFLPMIEAAKKSEALGEAILEGSLATLAGLDRDGLALPSVSVNFSLEELRNPRLAERIESSLGRHGLLPGRLTVEVLETVIASTHNDTVARNLWSLSELGCRIELDDFGTGHAGIGNIRRFAVNGIKIDRSFVTDIASDLEQQNMFAAILTLADRLALDTLAEGVESLAEREILARLGCRHAQGFGIARPMPAGDFAAWLRAYIPEDLARTRLRALAGE